MPTHRLMTSAALLLAAAAWVAPGDAAAQNWQLPDDDFTWVLGDVDETRRGGSTFRDFSSRGSQDGFNCTLTGSLRIGTNVTTRDMQLFEGELAVSLYFVEAAWSTMLNLDRQNDLDWAELACVKSGLTGVEADEAQQERLDRLRERALRRQEQRRERREREEERDD